MYNFLIDIFCCIFPKKRHRRFIRNKIKKHLILRKKLRHLSDVPINYVLRQETRFPHPLGIVIGKNVELGKYCRIYQNVTIGANRSKNPKIGKNVCIFANAVIVGDVKIGNNSIVGAGAVVLKDVPENSIVVGNPARIIKNNDYKSITEGKDNGF